jgi:ribonuclease HI
MVFIFTDGASRNNGGESAAAFIVMDNNESTELKRGVRYLGHVTNNIAEYVAVHDGIQYCYQNNILDNYNTIVSDSQLVVNQLNGSWKINNDNLRELNNIIRGYTNNSGVSFSYKWVPRTNPIIQRCDRMNNELLDMGTSRYKLKTPHKKCTCKK